MQSQVKEFFNQQDKEQEGEQKRKKKKRHGYLGVMLDQDFDVPEITDFSHFIECEVSPMICPMVWEDLAFDFDDINKRHCDYCDKFVYKADNEFMLKEYYSQNKCVAVSEKLFQSLHQKMDDTKQAALNDRLEVSKLFMVLRRYESGFMGYLAKQSLSIEDQLSQMLDFIEDGDEYEIKSRKEKLDKAGVTMELLTQLRKYLIRNGKKND